MTRIRCRLRSDDADPEQLTKAQIEAALCTAIGAKVELVAVNSSIYKKDGGIFRRLD